jgi:hypothetical protein
MDVCLLSCGVILLPIVLILEQIPHIPSIFFSASSVLITLLFSTCRNAAPAGAIATGGGGGRGFATLHGGWRLEKLLVPKDITVHAKPRLGKRG